MTTTPHPLRILFVEDLPADKELAEWQLRSQKLDVLSQRVDTQPEFLRALVDFKPDLIISDYSMPEFDGKRALKLAQENVPDIPFIVLTGSMNEDIAVECMKAGAADYVIKEHMNRLPFVVIEALNRQQVLQQKKLAEDRLRKSEASLKKAQQVAHVGDWVWYIQGNRYEWSDEIFRIFGVHKETVQGDLAEAMLRAIHPEDREAVERTRRSIIENGALTSLEYRVVWPDGTVRVVWAEAGELVKDAQGSPAVLTGIVQDITARKQIEDELLRKVEELERFQRLTVGRELKMIELKKEVNELLRQAGKPPRYQVVE